MKYKNIVWFDEVGKNDIATVGGKGANLGEMLKAGIPVPFGFIVTANAYFNFLKETGIENKIANYLSTLQYKDSRSLQETAVCIQDCIMATAMNKDLAREIMLSYLNLAVRAKKRAPLGDKISSYLNQPYVAVRSSATAEDLPTASFAGQQATFLNVTGETNLVNKVQEAWASLFTPRAIFYREENKFNHLKVGIAVPVQIMVNSDTSGVMFTTDPMTQDKNKIIIEAIYGLGELIVQGIVTPDHYEVTKKNSEIISKKIANQDIKLIRLHHNNEEVKVKKNIAELQKITDKEIIEIAKIGILLEKHYYFPQDIEWAIEKGKIYIVQTRPITTLSSKKQPKIETDKTQDKTRSLKLMLTGDPASPGIAWGPTKVIYTVAEISDVKEGDILVTPQTNPDFVPAMKKAVAIITEKGGRTSHAAIVSRELGIPAIVGAKNATVILNKGEIVTVDGSKGEIYKGVTHQGKKTSPKISQTIAPPKHVYKTATKVLVNLATPDRAIEVAKMNVDGVGLLRAEFMIANIGIHPKKLIKEHKEKIFINKLAVDLLKFAKAFNPRPVVYRATDFKTNEYRNLEGGKEFEPEEPNPMLGFRGAYRYMSDPKVFELELETLKLIRNVHGYKNIWLMLPFVRTVEELVAVKKIIAGSGLSRSSNFKLWMMVEIPSNVILLDKFCEAGLDGVSIGSNDLTMLLLGTDRDNTEVAQEFNERNPAVLWAIERVIKIAHKYGVTSSICGQAPSDYPELVEKLVEWGTTSMSVNPDAVNQVRETIYHCEQKLIKKRQ